MRPSVVMWPTWSERDIMSKYGNKKTSCLSKHIHDSKFEANHCNRLFSMVQRQEIVNFEIQRSFDLVVRGTLICRHIVDFLVWVTPNRAEIHETKGHRTAAWSIKRKLFIALFPELKYITISKKERSSWPQIQKSRCLRRSRV